MDLTGNVDDLIDVSAEDDSLLTSPATNYNENFDFSQSPATSVRAPVPSVSPKSRKECVKVKEQLPMRKDANCQLDEQNILKNPTTDGGYPPLCEEDLQPRKKRAAHFNLRKSLAWDQAFFTSEGVLNPVELSLLTKSVNKSNETLLFSIEEEDSVRSSMDSNSTLSGDILALETLEENLFTESHTSNASSFGMVPAQSKLQPLPNTKILATQQKNVATDVPKSPERKSSHGGQDSSIFKRSGSKGTEDVRKPCQIDDASGKNCASAPTTVTKKVPTGHKRMKYSHGNTVPVNGTKATMHRNTPSKAKENLGTSGRSVTSLNSSSSETRDSTKHLASSHKVEIPVPSATRDLSNNKILPKISSELVSSTISSDLTTSNSEPLVAGHNVREHCRPKTGSGVSADSAISHGGKQNQGFEKGMTVGVPPLKSISTSTRNNIVAAKDSTNYKQNHGFEKGKLAALPTKSVSTSAAHTSIIFSAKDPPKKSGCPRPVNLQSKPTGLRMPTPKHGFFDTEKVIRAPHPAVQKRSSSSHCLPPKPIHKGPSGIPQGSKLKPPGVPLPHNPGSRGTAPSVISMATQLQPESAFTSSITSIPAPLPRSQLEADAEGSCLGLLGQQQFGLYPRGQQDSHDQRSNQIQLSSGACNAAAQSSFSQVDCHNQKSSCSNVSEEEHSKLSFVHEKQNFQNISHTCSEQKSANANGTVISSLTDTCKASDMNNSNCLQPHDQHGTAVVADTTTISVLEAFHSKHLLFSSHEDIDQCGTAVVVDTTTISVPEPLQSKHLLHSSHEDMDQCGTTVVADTTTISVSEPLQSKHLLHSSHEDMAKVSEEQMSKSEAKEISSNRRPLDVNSSLLNSLDNGNVERHVNGQKNSVDSTKTLTMLTVLSPILDDIAEKENILGQEGQAVDSYQGIHSREKLVDDVNVQVQNIKNLEAPPFSEEWLRAMEEAGEELLQMKSGRVQHSPPDKIIPEPGPWSPVRRHSQQIGPFDCTKYTNAPGASDDCQDQ